MRATHRILALTAILAGCAAQAAQESPPVPRESQPTATSDDGGEEITHRTNEGGLVSINLTAATVVEVLRAAMMATGEPVVIGPRALPVAECAEITVLSPRPMRPEQVFELIRPALESAGLELEQTESGYLLRLIEGAEPFPSCDRAARRARNAPPPLPTPPAGTKSVVDAAVLQEIVDGVTMESDTSYKVTKRARDLIVDNLDTISKSVRILPYERSGKVVGIKLYGIRRSSVPAVLGFLNGDIVTKINGLEIDSPDAMLKAYSACRTAKEVTVKVNRRSQDVLLRYKVEGGSGSP